METGKITFYVDVYIQEHGISKNRLAKLANLQRTRLAAYCNNKIQRPDIDVLSRLCHALNCDLSDIMRYEKPKEDLPSEEQPKIKGK